MFVMFLIICLILLCPDSNSRFLYQSKGLDISRHELFDSAAICATSSSYLLLMQGT